MLGFEPGELVDKKIHDLTHHTRADGTPYPIDDCPMHHSLERGTVGRHDNEVLWRKDGSSFPVEYTSVPMKDGGNTIGSVVIFHDITERMQAEGQLRKLSRAVEQSSSSVIITDRAGRIEYANPKFTEVTGYALEEVLGKNPRVLKSGDQPKEFYADMWATIASGREWHGEFCNRKKNGDLYWLDPTTTVSHRVTDRGDNQDLLNGVADWVYEEELDVERSYWWSPDGTRLVYVGFTSKGFDLYAMALNRNEWLPALPFVRLRPTAGSVSKAIAALDRKNCGKTGCPKVILSDKAYNPLWTLPPETWWATWDGSNQALTLQLSGQDAVGYHAWALAASYGFATGNWSLAASYNYSRLYTPLHLGLSHNEWNASNWEVGGKSVSYQAMSTKINLGLDLPVLRSFRYGSVSFKLRYRFQHKDCRDCPENLVTPQDPLPVPASMPKTSGLGISLEYIKVRGYGYSVSPEKGTILAVTAKAATPALGADYTTSTLTWHWTQFVPMPWLEHHVLVARYTGGIGWGDAAQRTLFGVGGFGTQDYLDAIVNGTVVYGSSLRGYAPNATVGDHYHLLNLEYRFPLFWINRGLWTIPFLARRVWGTLFADWGMAYFGNPGWKILEDFRLGVGAEVLLEIVMGYELPMTLRIGYAYGVNEDGGHRYYIFFGVPLS